MKNISLTLTSLNLLKSLVADACNWSGNPLVTVSAEERGNLTALKKAGLLSTFNNDGCMFVKFTAGHFCAEAGDIKFFYSALSSGPYGDTIVREM